MTAIERIQKASCKAIRRMASTVVTLLPDEVITRAVIDRVNKPFSRVESEFPVQGEVGVTIYFDKDDLTIDLHVGMIVQESDADETKHVIGEIKDLGFRYQCFCSSEPIT